VDDALDVWAVHGVGGTLGAILTGVFAVAAVGGVSGLVEGNGSQVLKQLVAVGSTWIYSGVATFVILKVVDRFVGLRVEESKKRQASTRPSTARSPGRWSRGRVGRAAAPRGARPARGRTQPNSDGAGRRRTRFHGPGPRTG